MDGTYARSCRYSRRVVVPSAMVVVLAWNGGKQACGIRIVSVMFTYVKFQVRR